MLRMRPRCFVLAIVLAVIASAAAQPQKLPVQPPRLPAQYPTPPDRARRRTPIVEVFERCRDAVVNISTTRIVRTGWLGGGGGGDLPWDLGPIGPNREIHSIGSGAVIHESGYIVTNAHVVAQASDISVTFADRTSLPADIVAVDAAHDLAIIKVTSKHPFVALRLGAAGDIMVGETVVAIGDPLGYQHTVTTGIISAIDRDLQVREDLTYKGLIQTDAPINPGNSGGPLLNVNSELMGINTAIRGDAQNIGFAIPIARLWELLPQLLAIERRERVRFGLEVNAERAEVTAVAPNTPAATAGLTKGDRVIEMDGEMLRNGIDYYVRLQSHKAGDIVRLRVARGSKVFDYAVKLEEVPMPDGQALAVERLGIKLDEIRADVRRAHGLANHVRLIVTAITPDSPADHAGMKVGDLILRLDRGPVLSLNDVGLALEHVPAKADVTVDGVRLDPFFSWSVKIQTR